MAQTPARDIIKDAVVDFRFYTGQTRNFANNAEAIDWLGYPPVIQPTHGFPALTYVASEPAQSWMVEGITEVTIEALASPDLFYFMGASAASSATIMLGDWNLGFALKYASDIYTPYLWGSFNGSHIDTDNYYFSKDLSVAGIGDQTQLRGMPLHIVVSAKWVTSPSDQFDLVVCVNGNYLHDDTSLPDYELTAAPSNTLLSSGNSPCPIHLLRMWDSYIDDELVLKDLFRAATKILPTSSFVEASGSLVLDGGPA
jgi:hypothetical protein